MSNSSHPSDADVARWMQTLAEESPTKGSLPDPHLLWLKARLEERAERNERALHPIAIAKKIAVAIFALLGSAGLIAIAQHAETWVTQAPEPAIFAVGGRWCLFHRHRLRLRPEAPPERRLAGKLTEPSRRH